MGFQYKWPAWLHLPFTLGPIGSIQPFEAQHGEWGPPVDKITDMDWEIWTIWLMLSDVFVSVLWHFFAVDMMLQIRVRWMSPTSRFSVGYLFGTARLGAVLYFFRAKPTALYIYLHIFSFILHTLIGVTALIFNDGPWKTLRPNSSGVFHQQHPVNPYVFFPAMRRSAKNLVDHVQWGILQWLVYSVSQARNSWLANLPWAQFRLMPGASMLDKVEANLPTRVTAKLNQIRQSYNRLEELGRRQRCTSESSCSSGGSASSDDPLFDDSMPYFLSSRKGRSPSSSISTESSSGSEDDLWRSPTPMPTLGRKCLETPPHRATTTERSDRSASEGSDSSGEDAGGFGFFVDQFESGVPEPGMESECDPRALEKLVYEDSPRPATAPGNIFADQNEEEKFGELDGLGTGVFATDDVWVENKEDDLEPKILLQGPGDFKLTVPPDKWNESLLFWARPALEHHLSRGADDSPRSHSSIAEPENEEKGLKTQSHGSSSCCEGGATRATLVLRGDGLMLAIRPIAPKLRAVVLHGLHVRDDPVFSKEVIVELIGKRVQCKSGTKTLYLYADFPEYGMRLTQAQRSTVLWVLNTLNRVKGEGMPLASYRCPNNAKEVEETASFMSSNSRVKYFGMRKVKLRLGHQTGKRRNRERKKRKDPRRQLLEGASFF